MASEKILIHKRALHEAPLRKPVPLLSLGRFSLTLQPLTLILCLIIVNLCGCSIFSQQEISRIALLAPFEGRYREIGYDAYYAVRLALSDGQNIGIELLAVDDGGTAENAVERAKALAKDPLVKAVIALGYAATDTRTQQAFGQLPVMIVGGWGTKPATDNIYMLTNPQISDIITTTGQFPITDAIQINTSVTGSEVFALKQFIQLRPDTNGIRIASSGSLPDGGFRERYLQSGLYVPEPGLLATLTYDAAAITLQAIHEGNTQTAFESMQYEGINGLFMFENGYWTDAPIHYYCYKQSADSKAIADMLYECSK